MAADGSWQSIRLHGLLSTSALLDLFQVEGEARNRIEAQHRPEYIRITHSFYGEAWIRDQKPMDDSGLRRALKDGLKPEDWYRLLNQRVFFWVTTERLERLIHARAYRDRPHLVLSVNTASLLAAHADHVSLSPMNSGATKPFPHARGLDTFLPLTEYPFEERRRRSGEPIVELAVTGGVPHIAGMVRRVERRQGDQTLEILYEA